VTVNVPIPEGYIIPEGAIEITTNGTHFVTNYAEVHVNISSEQPQLYAPIVTLVDNILSIEDNENNGAFTAGYDIYVNGELKASVDKEDNPVVPTTGTIFDLTSLELSTGSYSISVRVRGVNFKDSIDSEIVEYVVILDVNDPELSNFTLADGSTLVTSDGNTFNAKEN
jgi:hypothetical protein